MVLDKAICLLIVAILSRAGDDEDDEDAESEVERLPNGRQAGCNNGCRHETPNGHHTGAPAGCQPSASSSANPQHALSMNGPPTGCVWEPMVRHYFHMNLKVRARFHGTLVSKH